jgi:hypothetical protein
MTTRYTRRHYEDLSRVLRSARLDSLRGSRDSSKASLVSTHFGLDDVESRLISLFAVDNSAFSVSRFQDAASLPDGAGDLRCPFCSLWIGDPDDPNISHVSVEHDFDECERRENNLSDPDDPTQPMRA